MEIIKPGTQIPFLSYRRKAFILSGILSLAVLILLFAKGPKVGVDFAGGTMVHLKFHREVTIGEIRGALARSVFGDSVVQDFGGRESGEFLIRLETIAGQLGTVGREVRRSLSEQFGSEQFEVRRIESVGPKVGKDLRRRGILSVIVATVMMGAYIWFRFELRFGLGAILALFHDVLITIGALVLANYEFDLPIVASLLTIAGYSVNDTVVVCDRIRENMRKHRREGLEKIINMSVNETLGRTIITTATSLLVLIALFVLGGGVIRPFAFALLIGFVSGVYSTVFIATPVILLLEKGRRKS
ncbi:MAG: protein translocase subunit SecF [Deltaproteobacteria bacterium]|nr:protein translocase subunit SecF [Deltaproteobacteria bacterium]MCZ6562901.1 protein translocase subunit SecF [Deltaproteobacteria bacterium]MCZ6620814.1 protein translocase subunit SecF [Deltaproteobacteria bacterium]